MKTNSCLEWILIGVKIKLVSLTLLSLFFIIRSAAYTLSPIDNSIIYKWKKNKTIPSVQMPPWAVQALPLWFYKREKALTGGHVVNGSRLNQRVCVPTIRLLATPPPRDSWAGPLLAAWRGVSYTSIVFIPSHTQGFLRFWGKLHLIIVFFFSY